MPRTTLARQTEELGPGPPGPRGGAADGGAPGRPRSSTRGGRRPNGRRPTEEDHQRLLGLVRRALQPGAAAQRRAVPHPGRHPLQGGPGGGPRRPGPPPAGHHPAPRPVAGDPHPLRGGPAPPCRARPPGRLRRPDRAGRAAGFEQRQAPARDGQPGDRPTGPPDPRPLGGAAAAPGGGDGRHGRALRLLRAGLDHHRGGSAPPRFLGGPHAGGAQVVVGRHSSARRLPEGGRGRRRGRAPGCSSWPTPASCAPTSTSWPRRSTGASSSARPTSWWPSSRETRS